MHERETGRLGCDNCENMLRTLVSLARLNIRARAECCGTTSEENRSEHQEDTVFHTSGRSFENNRFRGAPHLQGCGIGRQWTDSARNP
jgi:hypothetical protein